jgi:glycosyltransferase involved in cell wall biosynthesis
LQKKSPDIQKKGIKMTKLPITVIMLTLNEEYNLPGAIENVKDWVEEIFIVDSCSTDKTVDIALEHEVKIVQRPFTNFGDQWNFALERLPIKTPWTFKLDPDERLTPELMDEMRQLLEGEPRYSGYTMDRRLWFMGKPLHVLAPVLRLWRTGTCRFSDVLVNEYPIVSGHIGKLKGILEHFDSPDLHHWYEKQNRYTTMEAIMRVKGDSFAANPRLFGSTLERRMFLKKHFYKIPFCFQLLYFYNVFISGAWRSGCTGLAWAHLRIEVMRAIELKVKEIKTTGNIPNLPKAPHGDFDSRIIESSLQKFVSQKD